MYSESSWNQRVLIPLWTVQITFLFLFVALEAVVMMELAGQNNGKADPVSSAFMAMFTIALLMNPLEMVFQAYRLLEPWLYLGFQVFKAVFGTAYAIIRIIDFVSTEWEFYQGWWKILLTVLLVDCVLMANSFYCSLVYGAIVVHRHRRSEHGEIDEKE